MKILFGFFLCSALTLSAATGPVTEAKPKDQGRWNFPADQWSRKGALVSKGMTRAEVVGTLGKWYSVKTLKNEPDVVVLRFYRDTAGPATLERYAGQDSLHYFMHEDRIEVFIKSGVLVDVVVTRGQARERHDEITAMKFPPDEVGGTWQSTYGPVEPVKYGEIRLTR